MIWSAYSFAWVHYYDRISEILQVILITLGVIIILTGVSALIQWKNASKNKKKRSASILMLLLFTVIHVGMFMSYGDMGSNTTGLNDVLAKRTNEGSFYFYVKSPSEKVIELKCTKETYEAIIVDEDVLYTMSYRSLNNLERKSVLGYIKTDEFIDNRP